MPRAKTKPVSGDSRLALGREIGAKLAKLDKGDRELVLEVAASVVAAAGKPDPQTWTAAKPAKVKSAAPRKALGASPLRATKSTTIDKLTTVLASKEDED